MDEQEYLYNGSVVSRSILEQKYGDNTDAKIQEHGMERAYDFNGSVVGESVLKQKYGDDYESVIAEKGIVPLKKKEQTQPENQTTSEDYGSGSDAFRPDGTTKGEGFLGVQKMKDGRDATEISIGVEIDGEETLIPTLVPTLSQEEKDWLLSGGDPTKKGDPMADAIVGKAVTFAQQRKEQGLPLFAEESAPKKTKEKPFFEGRLGGLIQAAESHPNPLVRETADLIDDIGRAISTGQTQGDVTVPALDLMASGKEATEEDVQALLQASERLKQAPPSDEMMQFQETYEKGGSDVLSFFKGLAENPGALPEIMISSFSAMANPASAAAGGTVAAGGALIGAAGGPAGAAAGAAASMPYAFAAAGGTLETGLSFAEFLQEEVEDRGLEFNEEGIRNVLEDQEALNRIRVRAATRGATIGVIDAFTGRLAGRVGAKLLKGTPASKMKSGLASSSIEMAGGSGGEATARALVGQEMDVMEIGLEGIAEGPMAVPDIIAEFARSPKKQYNLNGEPVSKNELFHMIKDGDINDIEKLEFGVENDTEFAQELAGIVEKKKARRNVQQAYSDISEESLNELTDIEMALDDLKENNSESANHRKKLLKQRVDEIIEGEYQIGQDEETTETESKPAQEKTDWSELIKQATSGKELDAIIDQMDSAQETTPDLIDEVSQKREVIETEVEQTESTEQVEAQEPVSERPEAPSLEEIQEYERLMEQEGPAMETEIEQMEPERASAMYDAVSEAMSDDVTQAEFNEVNESGELTFDVEAKIGYKRVNEIEFTDLEQQIYDKFSEEIEAGISEGMEQEQSVLTAEEVAEAETDDTNILSFIANYGLDESNFAYNADKAEFDPAFKREVFKKDGATIDSAREAFEEIVGRPVSISEITDAVYEYAQLYAQQGSLRDTAVKKREARAKSEQRIKEQTKKLKESTNKEVADWLRGQKFTGTAVMFDFGISTTVYNKAVDMIANQVEAGTKLGDAVAEAVRYIDSQVENAKWKKKAFRDRFLSKEMPEGFDKAWKKAVNAAEENFSRRAPKREQYEMVMAEFKKSELWKGLKESERTRVDYYVRDIKFNKKVPKVRKPRESKALREIRLALDNIQSKLKDADLMSRQAYQERITQLQKDYLKESAKIGKEQALEGLDSFMEDVKRREKKLKEQAVAREAKAKDDAIIREKKAKDKAVAREKEKAAQAKEKLKAKIKELREAKDQAVKDVKAKAKSKEDAYKSFRNKVSIHLKEQLPKGASVPRSLAVAISNVTTEKRADRVIDRVDKLVSDIAQGNEAALREEINKSLSDMFNPANWVKKEASRILKKQRISTEAQNEIRSIAEGLDAVKMEAMSVEELSALHDMVEGIFEDGRIKARDYQKYQTERRRTLKNTFTKFLSQKFKVGEKVTDSSKAFEAIDKKRNVVIADGKVYSSTQREQFLQDFGILNQTTGKFELDASVPFEGSVVPIPSQRGKVKSGWKGYHMQTVDFLTQLQYFMSDNASKEFIEGSVYDEVVAKTKENVEKQYDRTQKERKLKKKVFGKVGRGRKKLAAIAKPKGQKKPFQLIDTDGNVMIKDPSNDMLVGLFNVIQREQMFRKALQGKFSLDTLERVVDYVMSDKQLRDYASGIQDLYTEMIAEVNESLELEGLQPITSKKTVSKEVFEKAVSTNEANQTKTEVADRYFAMLEKIYGKNNIPEFEKYSPASVAGKEVGKIQDNDILKKMSPQEAASVISRNAVPVKEAPNARLQVMSALQGYSSWVQGMTNMETKMSLYRNLNAVFNSQNLSLIEQKYGQKFTDELRDTINRVVVGKPTQDISKSETWLLMSAAVTMFLNSASAVWQTLSMPNYAIEAIGSGVGLEYFGNVGTMVGSKGREAMNDLFTASWVRSRYYGNRSSIDLMELTRSSSKYSRYLANLLSTGYTPTKFVDSAAIVLGGAPLYRALTNKFYNENTAKGMSAETAMADAKERAMFQTYKKSNESQQSGEEYQKSWEQAHNLTRMFLTFGSVNLQMSRLAQRSIRDIKNRRGNVGDNAMRVIYFGVMQNAIFAGLARAFSQFYMDDSDDDAKKAKRAYWTTANNTIDSILRGTGGLGAAVSVMKDISFEIMIKATDDDGKMEGLREYMRESGMTDEEMKGMQPHQIVSRSLGKMSPVIGSKARGLESMLRNHDKGNLFRTGTEGVQFMTNIPAERVVEITEQFVDAANSDYDETLRALRLFNLVRGWQIEDYDKIGTPEPDKKAERAQKVKRAGE